MVLIQWFVVLGPEALQEEVAAASKAFSLLGAELKAIVPGTGAVPFSGWHPVILGPVPFSVWDPVRMGTVMYSVWHSVECGGCHILGAASHSRIRRLLGAAELWERFRLTVPHETGHFEILISTESLFCFIDRTRRRFDTLSPALAFMQWFKSQQSGASQLSSAARSRRQTQSTPDARGCLQRDHSEPCLAF